MLYGVKVIRPESAYLLPSTLKSRFTRPLFGGVFPSSRSYFQWQFIEEQVAEMQPMTLP